MIEQNIRILRSIINHHNCNKMLGKNYLFHFLKIFFYYSTKLFFALIYLTISLFALIDHRCTRKITNITNFNQFVGRNKLNRSLYPTTDVVLSITIDFVDEMQSFRIFPENLDLAFLIIFET